MGPKTRTPMELEFADVPPGVPEETRRTVELDVGELHAILRHRLSQARDELESALERYTLRPDEEHLSALATTALAYMRAYRRCQESDPDAELVLEGAAVIDGDLITDTLKKLETRLEAAVERGVPVVLSHHLVRTAISLIADLSTPTPGGVYRAEG